MKIGDITLGIEGENLVRLYSEKLGITIDEACEIFKQNKTAQGLLKEELALTFTGTDTNLSALMRATILRKFYDFEKLRSSEAELIRRHYGIKIKKPEEDQESGDLGLERLISAMNEPVVAASFVPIDKQAKIVSAAKIRFAQENEIVKAVAVVPEKAFAAASVKSVKSSRASKRVAKKTRTAAFKKTY